MALVSLKPSSKGIVALIVVAALLFFGCALAYMAAAGKLSAASSELKDKEAQVKAGREMAQKLEQSKLDYLDSRSQLRFLESSVSTQAYVPTLLKQIEFLGKSVKLKVVGVRPAPAEENNAPRKMSSGAQAAEGNVDKAAEAKPGSGQPAQQPKKPAPYDELKIDLEATGKYMSALDFIYKLTSFPKIIAVDSVEMSPVGAETFAGSPLLKIKIKVTAFVFSRETPVDPQAAPKDSMTSNNANREGGNRNEAG